MPNQPVELHVVSDATGETAARLVQALEAQFPEQDFVEIRHPRVESQDDLQLAVNRMRGRPAVVIFTLVQPQLREAMRTLCRRARLDYCDLLGQPIDAVARVSGQAATMTPGSRPPLNYAYFKRIEAIEFAVRYDDGVAHGLHNADVILVGVSRTSKTPLSIYLGYLGCKAANVPLVKGIEPPAELFEVDQEKVVGLTIDPNRLVEIRRARVRAMGAPGRTEVRRARRDLRGARAGEEAPPPAPLPGHRRLRALDRGDRAPHPARGRGARRRGGSAGRAVTAKPKIPLWRWGLWYARPARRGLHLLCPVHAVLVRAALACLARGVPGQATRRAGRRM